MIPPTFVGCACLHLLSHPNVLNIWVLRELPQVKSGVCFLLSVSFLVSSVPHPLALGRIKRHEGCSSFHSTPHPGPGAASISCQSDCTGRGVPPVPKPSPSIHRHHSCSQPNRPPRPPVRPLAKARQDGQVPQCPQPPLRCVTPRPQPCTSPHAYCH